MYIFKLIVLKCTCFSVAQYVVQCFKTVILFFFFLSFIFPGSIHENLQSKKYDCTVIHVVKHIIHMNPLAMPQNLKDPTVEVYYV